MSLIKGEISWGNIASVLAIIVGVSTILFQHSQTNKDREKETREQIVAQEDQLFQTKALLSRMDDLSTRFNNVIPFFTQRFTSLDEGVARLSVTDQSTNARILIMESKAEALEKQLREFISTHDGYQGDKPK